jgi:hypothetical protein
MGWVEFTAAYGDLLCVYKEETFPLSVRPEEVSCVSGATKLVASQQGWTRILIKGGDPVYVEGTYEEIMKKLRSQDVSRETIGDGQ